MEYTLYNIILYSSLSLSPYHHPHHRDSAYSLAPSTRALLTLLVGGAVLAAWPSSGQRGRSRRHLDDEEYERVKGTVQFVRSLQLLNESRLAARSTNNTTTTIHLGEKLVDGEARHSEFAALTYGGSGPATLDKSAPDGPLVLQNPLTLTFTSPPQPGHVIAIRGYIPLDTKEDFFAELFEGFSFNGAATSHMKVRVVTDPPFYWRLPFVNDNTIRATVCVRDEDGKAVCTEDEKINGAKVKITTGSIFELVIVVGADEFTISLEQDYGAEETVKRTFAIKHRYAKCFKHLQCR